MASSVARAENALREQHLIHLLDYIAVDYPEFVDQGNVLNEYEYLEQAEFSRQVASAVAALPGHSSRDGILGAAEELAQLIEAKADGKRVARLARQVRDDLVAAYGIPVAPSSAPEMSGASDLYQAECAGCHGVLGEGDGPQAAGLEPKPTNFRDRARQARRTIFGFYNTITYGVEDTAMAGFSTLPREDRWALAFYLAGFASDSALVARGRQLWNSPERPAGFGALAAITTATPVDAAATGPETAAVLAYLRTAPAALEAARTDDKRPSTVRGFPREFLVILAVAVVVLVFVYRRANSRRRERSRNQ